MEIAVLNQALALGAKDKIVSALQVKSAQLDRQETLYR